MMCTAYDRTCADEGMTEWNPGGVLWNYCCAILIRDNYYECAHDRETNENKFMCI